MDTARQIVDRRVNAIGVTEPLVQVEGNAPHPGRSCRASRIPRRRMSLIQETALLEFVDTGDFALPEGLCIRTSLNEGQPSRCEAGTRAANGETGLSGEEPPTFPTVLTGAGLREGGVAADQLGQYFVDFTLTDEGGAVFGGTHPRQPGEAS
jgi:preprotein translocase subunit SecD